MKNKLIYTLTIIALLLTGCSTTDTEYVPPSIGNVNLNLNPDKDSDISTTKPNTSGPSDIVKIPDSELYVHFLDVGQAHCAIIENGDDIILIDGGNRADSDYVINYLESLNVDDIDIIIATHPHEDHIGALPAVIEAYSVDYIYYPTIPEEFEPDTIIYREFLQKATASGAKNISPYNKDIIYSKDGVTLQVLFDGRVFVDDMNDYSIIAKLTNGNDGFVFPGDANEYGELLTLDIWEDNLDFLKADVLLVGHHGSSTSTCAEFLAAVSPTYAVISCGDGNMYGHPHSSILTRLLRIETLRTDTDGDIVFKSTGNSVALIN